MYDLKTCQHYTTNSDYILSGFEKFAQHKDWVDPFAGNGDLLSWASQHGGRSAIGYDVDSTKESPLIGVRDTLLNPPCYQGKYIIANPPYLARNKTTHKEHFNLYGEDDLYKCAIKSLIGSEGGILIVPLNFLSSTRARASRESFFDNYNMLDCKIFEESVFEDTDYIVCAFTYQKRKTLQNVIKATFYPSKEKVSFHVSRDYGWILGEEFYREHNIDSNRIGRWSTQPNIHMVRDIILARAIDTGSLDGRIGLSDIRNFKGDIPPDSRNLAHIRFHAAVSLSEQTLIIDLVNERLEDYRKRLHSVFLSSFRNSTAHYARKRATFEVLYKMIAVALRDIRAASRNFRTVS